MVGYDSSYLQNMSLRLHYAIPALLHPSPNQSLPPDQGWMFLTKAREWKYDPHIRLVRHQRRPSSGDVTPCPVEDNTDYIGHDLDTIVTDSMENCISLCQSDEICMGVTLHNSKCVLKSEMTSKVTITINTGSFFTFITK